MALLDSHYVSIDGVLHGESFCNYPRFLMAVSVQTAALYVVTRCFLGSPEEGADCIFRIGFHSEQCEAKRRLTALPLSVPADPRLARHSNPP